MIYRGLKYIKRKAMKTIKSCAIKSRLPDIKQLGAIRSNAIKFVRKLRCADNPQGRYGYGYKYGAGSALLYASIYAALFFHLVGELESVSPQEKNEWAEYIKSYQHTDGLFRDSLLSNEIAETEDWWGWRHLTLHALMALQALDAKPRHPLHFLKIVDTPGKVRRWMNGLNWEAGVAFTSNTVQNYGVAMQYARDFQGETALHDSINELLAEVGNRCNPRTGIWDYGFSDHNDALSQGVQAGYHFWLLYWYEGNDIPYAEKTFRSILRLQNRLGGFTLKELNSSACEDIDALDPLVRLSIRLPHVRRMAVPVVCDHLQWQLYNFNADGGACFRRDTPFRYGHDLMFSEANESTMFATWFRMLTIAYCSELLKDVLPEVAPYRFWFLECPGLHYSPYFRIKGIEK